MLVRVLTIKRKDTVILSNPQATREKGDKESGNDYALPVSRILWNCLEDS